jgi:hypothetical protein
MMKKIILRILTSLDKVSSQIDASEYKVVAYNYMLDKDYDQMGRMISDVKGGVLHVVVSSLPTDELMAWTFDHRNFKNGEIILYHDTDGEKEEHIKFEKARCVECKMLYDVNDHEGILMKMTINAEKMMMGNVEYKNSGR